MAPRNVVFAIAVLSLTLATASGATESQAPVPSTAPASLPYSEVSRPADEHHELDALSGRWKVAATWQLPGQSAVHVSGTSDNSWTLGGRFLECAAAASEGKDQIQATTLFGYDRIKHEYSVVSFSTLSTQYVPLTGAYYGASHTFVFRSEAASNAQRIKYRILIVVPSESRYEVQLFLEGPGTDPVKVWEATYTREAGGRDTTSP